MLGQVVNQVAFFTRVTLYRLLNRRRCKLARTPKGVIKKYKRVRKIVHIRYFREKIIKKKNYAAPHVQQNVTKFYTSARYSIKVMYI